MFSFSGTSMLNNLISPGARGLVGTVAQEEIPNKTAPIIKPAIDIDFVTTHLLQCLCLLYPHLLVSHFTISKNFYFVNIPFSTSNLVRASY
jgi:hypothetical protein